MFILHLLVLGLENARLVYGERLSSRFYPHPAMLAMQRLHYTLCESLYMVSPREETSLQVPYPKLLDLQLSQRLEEQANSPIAGQSILVTRLRVAVGCTSMNQLEAPHGRIALRSDPAFPQPLTLLPLPRSTTGALPTNTQPWQHHQLGIPRQPTYYTPRRALTVSILSQVLRMLVCIRLLQAWRCQATRRSGLRA